MIDTSDDSNNDETQREISNGLNIIAIILATLYIAAFAYAIYKHRREYDRNNRIVSILFGFIGISFIAYDYLHKTRKQMKNI